MQTNWIAIVISLYFDLVGENKTIFSMDDMMFLDWDTFTSSYNKLFL